MTTSYPGAFDSFINPLGTDLEATLDHAGIHRNANDAILALETKVGITSSAVTTTHEYKLLGVATGDQAVSKTGVETLTNKTLTTPTISSVGFTNANHNHTGATSGGQLTDAALSSQVTVPKGGTGQVSLTAYALLAGGTTSTGAVQSLAGLGTTGQVLTSNGPGALPTFQPAATGTTYQSVSPMPNYGYTNISSTVNVSSNTAMVLTQINVPQSIIVNAVSVNVNAVNTSGTVKLAIFSSSGQTKIFEVSQAISTTGTTTFTLGAPTTVNAGIYYLAILGVSTASIVFNGLRFDTSSSTSSVNAPTGKYVLNGTTTVTADTIPSTFTPTAITADSTARFALIRLDN